MKILEYFVVAVLFSNSSNSFTNQRVIVLKHDGVAKHYIDRDDRIGGYFTADTLHEKSKIIYMCSAIIRNNIFTSTKNMDNEVDPQTVFEGFKISEDFKDLNETTHVYGSIVKIKDPNNSNAMPLMAVNCGLEDSQKERYYYILYSEHQYEMAYFFWKQNEEEFHNIALVITVGNVDVDLIDKARYFTNHPNQLINKDEKYFADLEDKFIFSTRRAQDEGSICEFAPLKQLAICASVHTLLQKDKTSVPVENLVYDKHVCKRKVPVRHFTMIVDYAIVGQEYNGGNNFDESVGIAEVDMIGCRINFTLWDPEINIAIDPSKNGAGFLIDSFEDYHYVAGHVKDVIALKRNF